MLSYDTRILIALFVVSIFIFKLSKIRFAEIKFVVLFIMGFLALNTLAIYLFAPEEGVRIYGTRHLLFELNGRYTVTLEQLFYQLNIILKYIVVTPAALLFIVTTHPSEFAASLNRVGVHYKIAFAVSLALRYIPDIQRDFHMISKVQQARGVNISPAEKLGKRLKHASSIIIPLIFSSLERIDVVSNAMELRSFGKHKSRTWYSAKPLMQLDWTVLIVSLLLFALAMIITFYDGSRFYNPF